MAYSPHGLKCVVPSHEPDVPAIWVYRSTDAMTTVRGANYISDARYRQMRVGDLVYVLQVNGSGVPQGATLSVVLTVGASGADLTDGTAVTLTNS